MIRVIHKKCGKIAFYFIKEVHCGEIMMASNVRSLDGRTPDMGEVIICGSCGEWIEFPGNHNLQQQHWTDWFIIDESLLGKNKKEYGEDASAVK